MVPRIANQTCMSTSPYSIHLFSYKEVEDGVGRPIAHSAHTESCNVLLYRLVRAGHIERPNRRSLQNFIKSFAIRTEPEKCFFAATAYRAKSSFGSGDGLRCVITTDLHRPAPQNL